MHDADMETDIRLEKNTYNAGETAKGTLLIKADKSLKIRKLKFSVYGKERYEVEKYDTFFIEDLSPFLQSINVSPQNDDRIEIPQGSFAIPFHFSIPYNALESYHGKNARIVYEVEIHADIGWKEDYHHILSFEVLNPNMIYTFSGDRFFLGDEQEKREGKPYLDLGLEITNSNNSIPRFSLEVN